MFTKTQYFLEDLFVNLTVIVVIQYHLKNFLTCRAERPGFREEVYEDPGSIHREIDADGLRRKRRTIAVERIGEKHSLENSFLGGLLHFGLVGAFADRLRGWDERIQRVEGGN